jgi:hypothetical protein
MLTLCGGFAINKSKNAFPTNPVSHTVQSARLVEPIAIVVVFVGHLVQEVVPGSAANDPVGHGAHVEPDVSVKDPAIQLIQSVSTQMSKTSITSRSIVEGMTILPTTCNIFIYIDIHVETYSTTRTITADIHLFTTPHHSAYIAQFSPACLHHDVVRTSLRPNEVTLRQVARDDNRRDCPDVGVIQMPLPIFCLYCSFLSSGS